MKAVRTRHVELAILIAVALGVAPAAAELHVIDLRGVDTQTSPLHRVHGSVGDGTFGVPVAGPIDCDGDGKRDYGFAAFLGSPAGRSRAGEVYLVFGDGTISGSLDTAPPNARILKITGSAEAENAGSEIWMDDVTGDGLGDLIIGRQNFSMPGRPGAGALTILIGSPALRAHADSLQVLDLAAVPQALTLATFIGAHASDRLAIWMRTGDVTGDGINDILVAADQENHDGDTHAGVLYLIRGGPHLLTAGDIDLANLAASPLATQVARILPPADANEYHLGATCQVADLDGNGRGEVLMAAALNRAGASFRPAPEPGGTPAPAHAVGGPPRGTLYILWDDNFAAEPWPAGFTVSIAAPVGSRTIIRGGADNSKFGEEILGGFDYDNDHVPDLFVGDLTGDGSPGNIRPSSGLGHVLFNAPALKGVVTDADSLPPAVGQSVFLGPAVGAIAADTTVHGDFDDDGIADVAFSSPHADPLGRSNAGIVHIVHGQPQPWPARVDLADAAQISSVRLTEVWGSDGDTGNDAGDVLAYSASFGDVDFDGRSDLLINEMTGDGVLPPAVDVGNLIVLSAELLGARPICAPQPLSECERSALRSRLDLRKGEGAPDRLAWRWQGREGTAADDFMQPTRSLANYALCIYDSSQAAQPLVAASALAGLECAGQGCWQAARTRGFRYRSEDGRPSGVENLRLSASPSGVGRIGLRAEGPALQLPDAPLVLPATVQLVISSGASSECWQSEYQAAVTNDATRFVARTR
jgi:hypothetical protein